jgi:hypothetical protein
VRERENVENWETDQEKNGEKKKEKQKKEQKEKMKKKWENSVRERLMWRSRPKTNGKSKIRRTELMNGSYEKVGTKKQIH